MALKIVATHDDEPQPRAISASTSHCVTKSVSKPPKRFGAVMRNTSAWLKASKVSGESRRLVSLAAARSRNIGTRAAARATRASEGLDVMGKASDSGLSSLTHGSRARHPPTAR